MSGFVTLAVTLLAAAPASPVVPLVGEPAAGPATAAAPVAAPTAARPRVVVCLPKGSAALEPQVERAFSWATLETLGPDNVARRFPASGASSTVAADEKRLDELLRAAEADFLALKFDGATSRLVECR